MKSKLFLIGLALILVLNGCIQPSDEDIAKAIEETRVAKSTSTPSITNTPITTEIQCPIEEEQHNDWKTVFCETFDNNLNNWWTGADPESGVNVSVKDGKYVNEFVSENVTGYSTGWLTSVVIWEESKDYLVSIQGEIDSVFRDCSWGILVRGGQDDGYNFSIDNQGNYFLSDDNLPGERFLGNAKYGSHSAMKWDQPNIITAVVEGKKLTFYVNGTLMVSYESDNSSRKEISIILWGAEGVSVIYEFDNILIREKNSDNSING